MLFRSPEHSYLKDTARAEYVSITDDEAMDGFKLLAHSEGLIPALESAHAVAHLRKAAKSFGPDQIVILNLSGRGDKDVDTARRELRID